MDVSIVAAEHKCYVMINCSIILSCIIKKKIRLIKDSMLNCLAAWILKKTVCDPPVITPTITLYTQTSALSVILTIVVAEYK